MNDFAIRLEGLSKQYHIGGPRGKFKYKTARETLLDAAVAPFRRAGKLLRGQATGAAELDETIWALKDVCFEVKHGEIVGIIGRNGAGKSTLLRVLCRITEPTEGRARVRGRVGSLLEVGTGFHPELTGRENIYLNGAILGMSREEIERKFDEIVAFAEVDKFVDTPVKHYSSGMYLRLAFAVAAHLEPEILLVDEVLAVGDAQFQKKCLRKMGDVAGEGRTILFVSHNMVALQSLCQRAIWLNDGQKMMDGKALEVVSAYLHSGGSALTEQIWDDSERAPGNDKVRLHRVCVRPQDGSPSDPITMETPLSVEIEFWNQVPGTFLNVTLHVYTEQQIVAFSTGSGFDPVWNGRPFSAGLFRSTCQIPGNILNSGLHRVLLLVVQNGKNVIHRQEDALAFDVLDSGRRRVWYGKEPGVVRLNLDWRTEAIETDQ